MTDSLLSSQEASAGRKWFDWNPTIDVGVVLLTEFWMVVSYYLVYHVLHSPLVVLLVFVVLTNLVICGLLPVWWVAHYRRRPLAELGITTQRWLPSLLISVALAAISLPRLLQLAYGTNWIPHVIANAMVLWESLFVYGWMQLRFERAFGIIPAVLLAGLCFAGYHIGGNYPPFALMMLLFAGLLYAVAFRLTKNLLALWPIAVSVGSSVGTMSGGLLFDWSQVTMWAVVLVIQLAVIGYTWWKQKLPN
jgi:membrane protease YdiL (CAAX protease family)